MQNSMVCLPMPHLQQSDGNPIGTKASSFSPCFAYFSTHQLKFMGPPKPSSSGTAKKHFYSSPPITPSQMPSNAANHSQLPDMRLREPKARGDLIGVKAMPKRTLFSAPCGRWSGSHPSRASCASGVGAAASSRCSGEDAMVAETPRSNRGHREPRGLSPRPHYHEKSQQRSSGEMSGGGIHSLQPPGHRKSSLYFPSCQGPLASLPPHPRACFLSCLSQIRKSTGIASRGSCLSRASSPRGDFL